MPQQSQSTRAALILAAGFLVLFIGGGGRFAIGLTLKPMVEELGWTRSDLALPVTVFQFVSATCMFMAGRLADRMSLRLILVGGIVLSAVGIGLMYLVSAPWHALLLYGLVFAVGNGMASITPVGVMVTRAFPDRTGFANGIVTSGMSVGQLVIVAVLAAVLVAIGWRSVFFWVGMLHLLLVPLVLLAVPGEKQAGSRQSVRPKEGLSLREAARTRKFWILLVVYAICGFDDFFVSTHVVAFAQDRGIETFLAGNLLAVMGLTALIGVLVTGVLSDRTGPVWPTVAAFAARIAVFVLIMIDQSAVSVTIFALVFGATFLVTAPLTVLFVRDHFGMAHLGALSGLVTMVHHIFGGLGAYIGAGVFDTTGSYDIAFGIMLVVSAIAMVLTLGLRSAPRLP